MDSCLLLSQLMHQYTCESLLNTLRGVVEEWLGALPSEQKLAVEVKVQQSWKGLKYLMNI